MSTMTLERCKECGSKDTSWSCAPINNGQAVDGRVCMREVGMRFYRGCDHCSETLEVIGADEFLARLNAHLAQPAQATTCAGCGEHKATPLRIDAMGGYVCLTCIDQKLSSLLGEFGYPEPQPTQAVDVVVIREVIADMDCDMDMPVTADAWRDKLTRAISGEKAGRVGDEYAAVLDRLSYALQMHQQRRTTMQSLESSVADALYSLRALLPASPAPDKEGSN